MTALPCLQPDEATCVSRVEVAVCEAMRVVATAMCTRLASSADFKVLRAAIARRKPQDGDEAAPAEGEEAFSEDEGASFGVSTALPRASVPGSPRASAATESLSPSPLLRLTTSRSWSMPDLDGGSASARPSTGPAVQRTVDGAAVERISQQIPHAVALALGLLPRTSSATTDGGSLARLGGAPSAHNPDGRWRCAP